MSDLKLFRIGDGRAVELLGTALALEKPLQVLIENNMKVLFGVRFVASEHSTGKKHGGRIDWTSPRLVWLYRGRLAALRRPRRIRRSLRFGCGSLTRLGRPTHPGRRGSGPAGSANDPGRGAGLPAPPAFGRGAIASVLPAIGRGIAAPVPLTVSSLLEEDACFSAKRSFSLRTTGASSVEDAERTNSPISSSSAMTVRLSTLNSLASS
jgi:hypothetical protein